MMLLFYLDDLFAAVIPALGAHVVRQDESVAVLALNHVRSFELPIGFAHVAPRR